MRAFTYDARMPRVVFGAGALGRLPEEVDRLEARRVLLLCTPRRGAAVERARELLGERVAGVFDRARMHVPAEVAEAGRSEAIRLDADLCVCIGGGSAIGLGKAIALEGGPPLLAVPTTYSGSEMTSIWGLTLGTEKRTGRDPRVLPRTVVYDPELTLSLPPAIAAPSGINAMAHCVEALYAPDATPIVSLLAEEGIRVLADGLPRLVENPMDPAARALALQGAWLAGAALGQAAMGLHHRLCHVLGGRFDLPHAQTHTVVLPHAAAYNREAAPEAMARAARALGAEDAPGALFDLAAALDAPISLRDLGLREADLDVVADLVLARPFPNPRPLERDEVRSLLDDAFHGRRPRSVAGGRNQAS